jgi:hypothetical protein
VERRKAIRYPLQAPIDFRWEAGGIRQMGKGRTRDISEKGVFVLSPVSPPLGYTVYMNIILPPLQGALQAAQIQGEAQVLRIEPRSDGGETVGFALLSREVVLNPGEGNP